MDHRYNPSESINNMTDDSVIIFKVSSNNIKNNSFNLTEMALSLAMNLSGVERQYFYDAGAKDMYDAGEKLMKTLTLTKSQESNNNNPTPMVNLHCKDNTSTNSSTSMAVTIINTNINKNNVALSSPHSVSPSSTSSGFISEESEVIGPTTQAPIFNIRVPPPNSFVRHPINVQQSIVSIALCY